MFNQLIDLNTLPVATSLHWSEAFGAWLHDSGRKPLTISAYLQDMRHYFRYFGELNAVNVKSYFAMQDVDNTVKPSSRNRRLASMRVFVQWSVEAGFLDADPTVGVKRVDVELSPRDRTADEMSALDAVASGAAHLKCQTEAHGLLGLRDELIWNLFKDTGMRIHEIAGLQISDVELEASTINVLGKGGKKAPVIIPQRLVDVIAAWIQLMPVSVDGNLVVDWNGYGISTGQVRRRIQMMGEKAGVQDLKPHDLRHTYVYSTIDAAMSQGMDLPVALDVARKQSRHGDVRTTMKFYLHARVSQVRAVAEAR
jgi:site-specific recombinase XerC